jgi:hypothetical protein
MIEGLGLSVDDNSSGFGNKSGKYGGVKRLWGGKMGGIYGMWRRRGAGKLSLYKD